MRPSAKIVDWGGRTATSHRVSMPSVRAGRLRAGGWGSARQWIIGHLEFQCPRCGRMAMLLTPPIWLRQRRARDSELIVSMPSVRAPPSPGVGGMAMAARRGDAGSGDRGVGAGSGAVEGKND